MQDVSNLQISKIAHRFLDSIAFDDVIKIIARVPSEEESRYLRMKRVKGYTYYYLDIGRYRVVFDFYRGSIRILYAGEMLTKRAIRYK